MKVFILCLISLLMLLCSDGICQIMYPEAPRIDATMAYYMYKQGKVVLIDAMDPKTFAQKHILGSINITNDGPQDIERVRNMTLPFPRDKVIFVYCM